MKKEKTALLLLSALVLAAVVSCGSAEEQKPQDTSETGTETETEPVDEHPMLKELKDADYNDETFKILGEQMRVHFICEEPNGEAVDEAVYRRNLEIEERYNVKLDYNLVTWKEASPIIREEVASGDNTYDLVTSTHLELGGLLADNSFMDWNSVPNMDLSKPYYVADANKTYSIGDKTMLLFGDFMDSNINNCWLFLYNKRLAGDYDLPDLYKMVDEGKWTIDALTEMIKDVYIDLDNDGTQNDADFYGFATDIQAAVDSYTRAFEISAITKDENNYPVLDFVKESTYDAYARLYELYYNTTGLHYIDGQKAFMQYKDCFIPGNAIFTNTLMEYVYSQDMRNMKDDYGVLPYPKLNESQAGYYTYLDGTFAAQMVLVTASEDMLPRTGMITEALNAYSYEYVRHALYDNALGVKGTRDEASVRMLDIVLEGRRYSFDSFDENMFMFSPCNVLRYNMQKKVASIASYCDANNAKSESWLQSMIDAYNKSGS